MPIRSLPLLLLTALAAAQPAAAQNPASQDIDVDAMARAKDAGAAAETPATEAPPTEAAAQPPAEAAAAKEKAEAAATEEAAKPAPPLPAPAAEAVAERRLASACEARAKSLLDAAQKGDYKTATRDFDAKMRSAMPLPKFKQAWESLNQFGALQARGQSHPLKGEGYIAVAVPLIFEKANLYAQIACGSDGLVAGFYVKPLDMPQQQPQPQP
jgi:hypothetical protein